MGKQQQRAAAKASSPREVELRLTGTPEALKAAFDSALPAPKGRRADEVSRLDSRYFDTRNHRLREAGLALRVRETDRHYLQTLKAGDDVQAAMLDRSEWEVCLSDARPDPGSLPDVASALIAGAAGDDDLQPVFATRIERRKRLVSFADDDEDDGSSVSNIEAVLDLGEIDVESGPIPVAEIELELIDGRPDALYRAALDLQATGSLRLETRSKSSRAYERLADLPPTVHNAKRPDLAKDDDVDTAMAAIFRSCFDQWLANRAAALDGRDSEGVHQMRVGLRRLRSALSVFRKMIPEGQLAWLQPDAKNAINSLGPARDWDVFLGDLLAPVIEARIDDSGLKALRRKAETRRRQSHRRARQDLDDAEATRFALHFGLWLESAGWQQDRKGKPAKLAAQPLKTFAASVLNKRHGKVLSFGPRLADLSAESRHELRIAIKKLRYAVEFFGPVFDKTARKPYLKSLKNLQDDFGDLNDLAVAERLLEDLLARPGKRDDVKTLHRAAGLVVGWHAHKLAAREIELIGAWDVFFGRSKFWR
jgi:inorganic triphosphatase YgiF